LWLLFGDGLFEGERIEVRETIGFEQFPAGSTFDVFLVVVIEKLIVVVFLKNNAGIIVL
jgi:hypothetical protein